MDISSKWISILVIDSAFVTINAFLWALFKNCFATDSFLDDEDKDYLSKHLLHIVINECDVDLDSEISKIYNKNYSYKRWYDEVFDLSTAMEILKNLPENKQDYVVKRFLSEIIMSYAKKEL